MIPIVLYTTNRATAAAIRSANGMIPGLRGNDLLLESRQQPLPLSQGQPQIGDLSQIIRPGDRRDVDGLFLTVSAGFHQPHHPSHALTPDPRSDAKLPLRRPPPQSPGSPSQRYHERRATGRKTASPAAVLRGEARLIAVIATRQHPPSGADLGRVDRERWNDLRQRLNHKRQARILRTRFRRNPDAYLA